MKGKTKKLLCTVFAAVCLLLGAAGAADMAAGGNISVIEGETPIAPAFTSYGYGDGNTATVSVFGIPVKNVSVSVLKKTDVIAGGQSFGVKLKTKGVIISGLGVVETDYGDVCPGRDAGLCEEDVILEADGEKITSAKQFTDMIKNGAGKALDIRYKRGSVEYETTLYPACDRAGEYKAGMWVRDSAAGIGTITYIIPDSNGFGGLGHGICDAETGQLLPFESGEVYDAKITGVKRGKNGEPGELRGYFEKDPCGILTGNSEAGVFGRLDKAFAGRLLQIAYKDKVKEGDVTILCTVDDCGVGEYNAKITKILSYDGKTKNFIIKVTDPELIRKTGGIVQGMSGSPILQDGKLIGAVTHVLVNDPTKGYGIFIENMLENN